MHCFKLGCVIGILGAIASCDGGGEALDGGPADARPDSPGPSMLAPVLTSFAATPAAVTRGVPTDLAWQFTFAGLPFPEPMCTVDQGIGVVTPGHTTNTTLNAVTTFTITCSNSVGTGTRQLVVGLGGPVAPDLASFVSTPSSVTINSASNVTWSWSHYSPPPNPAPTCSISPQVGAVTNGQTTSINIAFSQYFTLTCTSVAGTRTRQFFVTGTSPVAPIISTFTATPSTVTTGVATNVTFAWAYANTPAPAPACSIDQGIGAITSGSARALTLSASTLYTLTCTNNGGTDTEQLSITAI